VNWDLTTGLFCTVAVRIHNNSEISEVTEDTKNICLKVGNRCSAETYMLVMQIGGGHIWPHLTSLFSITHSQFACELINSLAVILRGEHHTYFPVVLQRCSVEGCAGWRSEVSFTSGRTATEERGSSTS
jgi:hypothetical protein